MHNCFWTRRRYVSALFLILFVCGKAQLQLQDGSSNSNDTMPVVFLTVSSLASHPNIEDRLLELNWHNIPQHLLTANITVRLYRQDPEVNNISSYLVNVEPNPQHDFGYYRTDIRFPNYNFSSDTLTRDCLDFWIALIHDDEVLSSSCIRPFPFWMHDMRGIIGNASLLKLMIPGTHNAASYAAYDPDDDTILKRYLITQEESIWNQLVYGIRYLDLRIAYERVDGISERFWITHGVFRTDVPLKTVIDQVKLFLNSTKEIVIMDFHRFVNGFNGKRAAGRHRSLIAFLEEELSDYMIPTSMMSRVTLEELWQADRRLYVGYAVNSERLRSQYLFPAVKHQWGDKDKVQELFSYLNNNICARRHTKLTSAMAQLTPTTGGAIFDVYGGLRKMANDVNRYITKWFRDLWSDCSNIVSTDFFLGNDIIRTAIQKNKMKFCANHDNPDCIDTTENEIDMFV